METLCLLVADKRFSLVVHMPEQRRRLEVFGKQFMDTEEKPQLRWFTFG